MLLRAYIDDLSIRHFGGVRSQQIIFFLTSWAHVLSPDITVAPKFNPFHAGMGQSFPDGQAGEDAFYTQLSSSAYGALLNAIQTNDANSLGFGPKAEMATNVAADLAFWISGSRDYLKQQSTIIAIMRGAGITGAKIHGGTASGGNGVAASTTESWGNQSLGVDTSNLTVGGVKSTVANSLGAVNDFFASVNSFFSSPMRFVEIVGGGAMVIAGVVLTVKALGIPVPTAPPARAARGAPAQPKG